MAYKGDFRASDVVDLKFSTVSTAGVPTTLSGTPAISIYKSNSTTESTTGVSLTVDFDSRTGLNHVRITTASDGTFYAAGTDFDVVITTGTVGGVSVVGVVVASFSISNRSMQIDPNQVISTSPTASTLGEMWLMGLNRLGRRNTATAGGASTITLDAGASATDNIYATHAIKIIAGTGSGQFATIDSYVGSTKVATISRAGGSTWSTNPDNTSVFQIETMPKVNVGWFLYTLLTETTGQIAAAFKQFFNIASPTSTMNTITAVTTTTTATNLTNAATAGDFTSTMKSSLNSSTPTVPTAVAIRTEMDSNSVKLANLDVATSTRTKPADTQAAVTLVTTTTNLTNAPTAGDFTSTMKASLSAATPAVTVSDKTGFGLASTGLDSVVMSDLSAVPGATASVKAAINWLFMLGRNKRTQTATTELLRNDGDAATVGTSTKSDDGTTFTRGKYT